MLRLMEGVKVHLSAGPEDALRRFAAAGTSRTEIDLLISDIVMPGMNGFELADRMAAHHPDLKVLFISDYDSESTVDTDTAKLRAGYLSKPFDTSTLTRKVHQVLSSSIRYRD